MNIYNSSIAIPYILFVLIQVFFSYFQRGKYVRNLKFSKVIFTL